MDTLTYSSGSIKLYVNNVKYFGTWTSKTINEDYIFMILVDKVITSENNNDVINLNGLLKYVN